MSGLPSRRHTSDFIDPALLVDSRSPNDVAMFLDNYYGCQFKLLNDIKIHRSSGNFLFNGVEWVSLRLSKTLLSYICFSSYGFLNHFRPEPLMPNQVYRLNPVTRRIHVVATDFNKCIGIALSEDGKLAYMYEFIFLIHIFRLTLRPQTIRTDTAKSAATMQAYSVFFWLPGRPSRGSHDVWRLRLPTDITRVPSNFARFLFLLVLITIPLLLGCNPLWDYPSLTSNSN